MGSSKLIKDLRAAKETGKLLSIKKLYKDFLNSKSVNTFAFMRMQVKKIKNEK